MERLEMVFMRVTPRVTEHPSVQADCATPAPHLKERRHWHTIDRQGKS
jgi:hypothetical protein